MGRLVTHRQSLLLGDVSTIGNWPPVRIACDVFEESVVVQPDVADTEACTGLARERSFAVQPTKTKPESRCSSMQKQATRLRLHERPISGIEWCGKLGCLAGELSLVQAGVGSIGGEESLVVALLDDTSVLHHNDDVSTANRRESVGDDEAGATRSQRAHRPLDHDRAWNAVSPSAL